jgi:hypothetical protein
MEDEKLRRYADLRRLSKDYFSGLATGKGQTDVDPRKVGRLLGIYRNGKMLFQSENEITAMMDFAVAERIHDGSSVAERELASGLDLDADRRLLLEGLRDSTTSLFLTIRAQKEERTVRVHDLFNDRDAEIVDMTLSRTAPPGMLFFLRLINLSEFSMSSGSVFAFKADRHDVLVRRYRSSLRSRFTIDESVTRFLAFFRLNREYGEKVELR